MSELPPNVIAEAEALGMDPETYADALMAVIDHRLADIVAAVLEGRHDYALEAIATADINELRVLLGSAVEKLALEFEEAVKRGEIEGYGEEVAGS